MDDEKTNELILKARGGDKYSKNLLIQDNMKYVKKIVNGFCLRNRNLSVEDLIQEGIIAVMKAINSYDINKKVKFSTYVFSMINFTLISEIKKKYSYFKIPEHKVSKILKFKKQIEALNVEKKFYEFGCQKMEINYGQYADLFYLSNINNLIYLDEMKFFDGKISLEDMLACEDINYKNIEDRIDLKSILLRSKNELSNIEKYILKKIIIEDKSVKSVSEKTKMSAKKISNIKYNALKKIQNISKIK